MHRPGPNRRPKSKRSEIEHNGSGLAVQTSIGSLRQDVRVKRAYEPHAPEETSVCWRIGFGSGA